MQTQNILKPQTALKAAKKRIFGRDYSVKIRRWSLLDIGTIATFHSIYTVEEILNSDPLNTSIILISICYTDIFQKQLIALRLN